MALIDTTIRKAKPADKPVKLTDAGGLYLLLRPNGARWWRWDYRRPFTGKRNTLSLGTYPDTPEFSEIFFFQGPPKQAVRMPTRRTVFVRLIGQPVSPMSETPRHRA